MQFEMFEMLQFISANMNGNSQVHKQLSDLTERDVKEIYMRLKKEEPRTNAPIFSRKEI